MLVNKMISYHIIPHRINVSIFVGGSPPGVSHLLLRLLKSKPPSFLVYEWPSQQRIHNENNKGCTGSQVWSQEYKRREPGERCK